MGGCCLLFPILAKSLDVLLRQALKMYKSLYDFDISDSDKRTLAFKAGVKFTVLKKVDEHWFLAQNGHGKVGYIPVNYVIKDEVALSEVVKSVHQAIACIHAEAENNGKIYTQEQKENLRKLIDHRKNVVEEYRVGETSIKGQAPPPPIRRDSSLSKSPERRKSLKQRAPSPPIESSSNELTTMKSEEEFEFLPPPPQMENISENSNGSDAITVPLKNNTHSSESSHLTMSPGRQAITLLNAGRAMAKTVPDTLGVELVEILRKDTNIGYNKCKQTLATLLTKIQVDVPAFGPVIDEILKCTQKNLDKSSSVEYSHDAERLDIIFSEMAECKNDSQQRSWALYEDESIILEYLQELLSILGKANPMVCKYVISKDNYQAIDTLVLYYQMEARTSIRNVLLNVFAGLCGIEPVVIPMLLNSVLPLELARDIQTDASSLQKFCFSCVVLTVIFSSGEELPLQHYEFFNLKFVEFLLDCMENPVKPECEDEIIDAVTPILLSFNLHFYQPCDSLLMKVLAQRGTAKAFTEKVMMLVNAGDDPVKMYDHQKENANSVLKFLSDVFSATSTSDLFYTNDAKVLIDIIIREISNLTAGHQMRTEFLSLVHLIVINSSYKHHLHRAKELQKRFLEIQKEEGRESIMDQDIVKQIWKDAPQYFGTAV